MLKNTRSKEKLCACGSGQTGAICCLRLISGEEKPQSPEQLMRSRYTAYVMGETAYILSSWHSTTRPVEIELENTLNWTGLRVLKASPISKDTAKAAFVEFIASFNMAGESGQMHELSRFLLEQGDWKYVDGEQIESGGKSTIKKPGRNDPCICGSGKKYKKCCG